MRNETSPGAGTFWFRLTIALAAMMAVYAAFTGRLTPVVVPDTPSYWTYPFGSLDAALRSIRTPLYPAFLNVVRATLGTIGIPIVQLAGHSAASAWVGAELRRRGLKASAAVAAAVAIALGCTFNDNVAIVATDLPAASLGVATVAATLRWIRLDFRKGCGLVVVVLATLAIFTRPAYLALGIWIPLATPLLARIDERSVRRGLIAGCLIAIALAFPVLGWMTLRKAVVDDFGLLPFGHQNLAGITAQLIDRDELRRTTQLGESVASRIQAAETSGQIPAADYPMPTMLLEARWNDVIYAAVVPAARARHPGDAITQHHEIAALNRQILSRHPTRYVRWLALAARRAVWGTGANILMHPIFLPALVFATATVVLGILRRRTDRILRLASATDVLFVVAISYAIVMIGFVILSSPPLGRFADAGAIFLPAWLAAVWFSRNDGDRSTPSAESTSTYLR